MSLANNDQYQDNKTDDNKTDLICATLLALAAIDKTVKISQSSLEMFLLSLSIYLNPHLVGVAFIVTQPHAAPETVDAYHISEKYTKGVDAPAAAAHSDTCCPLPFCSLPFYSLSCCSFPYI